jgi:hypothetical protein
MFQRKYFHMDIIFYVKRIQIHRYAWDRHVLDAITKQSIQPYWGASGTVFDEFGLAWLHSFTCDASFTCNMHKRHPTKVNGINKLGSISSRSREGAGKTKNMTLCQSQRNNRHFHVFVCKIQVTCLESWVRWSQYFWKEILIEIWLLFMGVRGV